MKATWILALSGALMAIPVNSPADSISDLRSPDITVRRTAIDSIQTEDDSRIPAVCLPLLQDEGYSIRRQAARAIGSRFAQIPVNEHARYVQALQNCEASGPDDVTLMCQRAIGLLTRNYAFSSFSVSPNGKWVLYERRRLPVIANVVRQQHFLLSPYDPAWLTTRDEDGLLKMIVTMSPRVPFLRRTGNRAEMRLPSLSRHSKRVFIIPFSCGAHPIPICSF